MDNTTTLANGTPVTFTADTLGAMADLNNAYFEDDIVMKGDKGIYLGPHPVKELADQDWHLVEWVAGGRKLLVPCHVGQFDI